MDADPLRVIPRLIERIWGRTDLEAWYDGAIRGSAAPLGEAWLTDMDCDVEGGGIVSRRRASVMLYER